MLLALLLIGLALLGLCLLCRVSVARSAQDLHVALCHIRARLDALWRLEIDEKDWEEIP